MTQTTIEASDDTFDINASGALTIILQGGLSPGNAVETANHCRHWRQLFPAAEIILSLSGTTILQTDVRNGILHDAELSVNVAHDSTLQAALASIQTICDLVVIRSEALPLPPIKSDSPKLNNVNLQIAAAQNGLEHATGRYVLRVRSDLIFLDRTFLDQYRVGAALPRGDAAALTSRVLISWLYTLNPYTLERLPLHLSDWFNFGLLEDVRKLWDIPYIDLADAVHYVVNPFAEHSNLAERLFNIRLADEQFIAFNALRKLLPNLKLDYHNDHSEIDLAMDVLLDNFTLSDLSAAKCIFEKYSFEFEKHEKTLHCITPLQWRKLVENRGVEYRSTLSDVITEAIDPGYFEQTEDFPRIYEASRLHSKSGRKINGAIVTDHDGVLSHGPYVVLPRGRYVAHVDARILRGEGSVKLRATLQRGAVSLASRTIPLIRGMPTEEFTLPFEITAAFGRDFEMVVETQGVRQAALHRIVITRSLMVQGPLATRHVFEAAHLRRENGVLHEGVVVNAARGGVLARSPIFRLSPSTYCVTVETEQVCGNGETILQVVGDRNRTVIAERSFPATTSRNYLRMSFVVDSVDGSDVKELQIVCGMRNQGSIAVRRITIDPDPISRRPVRDGAVKLASFLKRLQS